MAFEQPDHARFVRRVLFPAFPFDLVVIAASAGGVTAVKSVLRTLPPDFPTPIAIVQHLGALPSRLADIFNMGSRVPVKFAEDGERLRGGRIYVAPINRHLGLSDAGTFELLDLPKVNYVRPAADILLGSASKVLGPRLLAAVLTGMGKDGMAGAERVKREGGIVIAQEPSSAFAPSMPLATVQSGHADLVLDLEGVGRALVSLAMVTAAREWLGLPRTEPPLRAYA